MNEARILVPVADAARMLSMGKSTFWREVKAGVLPKPIKIGTLIRWRVADILRHAKGEAIEPEAPLAPKFVVRPRGFHLYRHFDSAGTLLYVGISLSAVGRLEGHRNDSAWFWSVATVTIEVHATREEAEAAEREAIKAERPLFNRTFGDKRRCDLALEML